MKYFNITIINEKKFSSSYRVTAKNEEEAIKKVKTIGFNCGWRLSSGFSGKFVIEFINEVGEDNHKEHLKTEIQRLKREINEREQDLKEV